MKPRLDKTTAQVLDIGDQPDSEFVLILEGISGDNQAYAVDSFSDTANYVTAYRALAPIVKFPHSTKWIAVNRNSLKFASLREVLRLQARDAKQLDEYRELVIKEEGLAVEEPPKPEESGIHALDLSKLVHPDTGKFVGHYA